MRIPALLLGLLLAPPTFAAVGAPSLEDKLQAQWGAYGLARAALLERVEQGGTGFSRNEWETLLQVPTEIALTAEDLSALRADQDARVASARDRASLESPFDLAIVRAHGSAPAFCAAFPKGGMLHVHPSGTLDRATARELFASSNPSLTFSDILQNLDGSQGNAMLFPAERDWLTALPAGASYLSLAGPDRARFEDYLFLPPGKQPFPRFNAVFEFLGFAFPDYEAYHRVLLNFAQKAAREGVLYVEFTSGGNPAFYAILSRLEQETGLVIRSNRAFNRRASPADLEEALGKLLAQAPDPHVVGIDFLDNEEGHPALEAGQRLYGKLLGQVLSGKSALHRTMHAGEIGDLRNPRDAMILGAERLGHGVNLARDPVALEYAALLHEPVEINLSSNLRLTDVVSVGEHPFLRYLRLGLPVSLSTDDEGIFETDMNRECEQAVALTDVRYSELKQMAFNSIDTSFADAAQKKTLREKLTERFGIFEQTLSRY